MTTIIPENPSPTKQTHACPTWCVRDHATDPASYRHHGSSFRRVEDSDHFSVNLARVTFADPARDDRTTVYVSGGLTGHSLELDPLQALQLARVLRALDQRDAADRISELIDELHAGGAQ